MCLHRIAPVFVLLFVFAVFPLFGYEWQSARDGQGRAYKFVPGEPFGSRFYTLSNGMTLILSRNTREPRVSVRVAVRAGSKNDPSASTGLAHYFEHMMFKGNEKIASLNWEKEKPLLDEIENLFELHRKETDPAKRAEIYKKIDSLSQDASKYSNDEYWNILKSIGAEGTNAYTSYDETVYLTDVPAANLEKLMALESVRFSSIALRRFHTELETVYEEFNTKQDKDSSMAFAKMMELLFPGHPYARLVIGLPEHLKSPSMRDIKNFFQKNYVPGNMALIMSGDLDFEKTAAMAEQYFGKIPVRQPPEFNKMKMNPIRERKAVLSGPQPEMLYIGFRLPNDKETGDMVTLIDGILANGQCGLIDLDVILPQKALAMGAGYMQMNDALLYVFTARPRQGQTLEQLEAMIYEELAKLKNGEYPDWLPHAVVDNALLSLLTVSENRKTAVAVFTEEYVSHTDYAADLNSFDRMDKLTKKDIAAFTDKYLTPASAVVVYKRQGRAVHKVKAEKPSITPVSVSDETSSFAGHILSMPAPELPQPVFPVPEKEITHRAVLPGVDFYTAKNTENERFTLQLNYQIGTLSKGYGHLGTAFSFADFIGRNGMTQEEIQKELYRLAGTISFSCDYFTCRIKISGLQRNFDKLMALLPDGNFTPDESAWSIYRADIFKSRENAKKNKMTIARHADRYGFYNGLNNLANHYPSADELNRLTAKDLTGLLKKVITTVPVEIAYYGPCPDSIPVKWGKARYPVAADRVVYHAQPPEKNTVLLVDYPSVQTIVLLSRADKEQTIMPFTFHDLFNEYIHEIFWSGLREEKGLVYSANGYYVYPTVMLQDMSFSSAYAMTQPDKLPDAMAAMAKIFDTPVVKNNVFSAAKANVLSRIRNHRYHLEDYYALMAELRRRNLKELPDQTVYRELPGMTPDQFRQEWQTRIAGKPYLWVVLGDLKQIDRKKLEQFGEIKVVTVDEVFR